MFKNHIIFLFVHLQSILKDHRQIQVLVPVCSYDHCIDIPTTLERKHSTKSISIINQKSQLRCERLTTFFNFYMATSSIFWVPFSPYGRNHLGQFISHPLLLSLEGWPKFWETNVEPDIHVGRVEKRAEAFSYFQCYLSTLPSSGDSSSYHPSDTPGPHLQGDRTPPSQQQRTSLV